MTIKEARDRLRRWGRIPKEIERIKSELKELVDEVDALYEISGRGLDGMPHGGGVGRPTESAAMNVLQECARIKKRLGELSRKIEEAEQEDAYICGLMEVLLDTRSTEVLFGLYRKRMTRKEVANALAVSERTVGRIEAAAVQRLIWEV